METIHLSKFTTKLQGLCHDGFALYDVTVREEMKDGSFCDRKIKNVAIDAAKKQVAFYLEGNSRIDELERQNENLKIMLQAERRSRTNLENQIKDIEESED